MANTTSTSSSTSTTVIDLEQSYLRTAEVAELLQVSPKSVSRWAKEGKLPFLKTLGGHRRYPEREIRQLADGLRVSLSDDLGSLDTSDDTGETVGNTAVVVPLRHSS